MIHFFHGFLGSSSDFGFVGENPNFIFHDLYQESLQQMKESVQHGDTLVGYSMGGRVAMEIALSKNVSKMVLMSCHPGLESDDEKTTRTEFEDAVQKKLETLSPQAFTEYWNNLPLFKANTPLNEIDQSKLNKSLELFNLMRLSKQTNYLPMLENQKQNILWVFGKEDSKYQDLAQGRLLPQCFRCVTVKGGHRVIEHSEEILDLLRAENIL